MILEEAIPIQSVQVSLVDALKAKDIFIEALGQLYSEQYYQLNSSYFSDVLFLFEAQTEDSKWTIIKKQKDLLAIISYVCGKYEFDEPMIKQQLEECQMDSTEPQSQKGQVYAKALRVFCQKKSVIFDEKFKKFLEKTKDSAYRQFQMYKKNGGRYKENSCCKLGTFFKPWRTRLVSIYHKGVSYRGANNKIRQFLPFDHGFQYFYGKPKTSKQFGIILISNHRRLCLQAQNVYDFILFVYLLKKVAQQSTYMSLNRYNSFAPIRYKNETKFYVDGQEYFEQLANALLSAKKSIYLTGWMISPEFLMIRKHQNSKQQFIQFQDIIKKAADKGVIVSIIVYHESSFLSNDSLYTKQTLQKLSPNITVLRHPNGKLPVLWSHHAKMAIIDENIAFFGGLDICYGRYDDQNHYIFDEKKTYPGIEYNNIRKVDCLNVRQPGKSSINRNESRLPWHDVAQSVTGQIVCDFTHHFNQFWNFVSYQTRRDQEKEETLYNKALFEVQNEKSIFSSKKVQKKPSIVQKEGIFKIIENKLTNLKEKGKNGFYKIKDRIIPNDVQNQPIESYYRMAHTADSYFTNYLNSIKCEIEQKKKVDAQFEGKFQQKKKKKSGKHRRFSVQAIKDTLAMKQKENETIKKKGSRKNSSFLLSGQKIMDFMNLQINSDYIQCLQKMNQKKQIQEKNVQYQKDCQSDEQINPNFAMVLLQATKSAVVASEGLDQCQMIRSVGNWSIGCHPHNIQYSIQIAYLQLISQAKYYIYIQNQFFISSTADQSVIKNEIAFAIYKRIAKAIENNQVFRVYIMLPLLPGFAGNLQTQECTILRKQMEWQYDTIFRSNNSLIKRILTLTNNPDKYIQFFSLRNHGRFDQTSQPQTQIIYLHSKLIIVDDEMVLCGSANINDRSLLGNRDSQIAVVTHGEQFVEGIMNTQKVVVSSVIQQLRLKLWKEHFGLSAEQALDPIIDATWQTIINRANNNTLIYRQVFGCIPDNTATTRRKIMQLRQNRNIAKYDELKDMIIGNVVEFPLDFLNEDKISLAVTDKEFYMPTECLT